MNLQQFLTSKKEALKTLLKEDDDVLLKYHFYDYRPEGTWERISFQELFHYDQLPLMPRFEKYSKDKIFIHQIIFKISEQIDITLILSNINDMPMETIYVMPNLELIKDNIKKTKSYF